MKIVNYKFCPICVCYVVETVKTNGGREREVYEAKIPYEKLKEVSKNLKRSFLRPGATWGKLDQIAYQYSDNEFAKILREEEKKLFNLICLKTKGSVILREDSPIYDKGGDLYGNVNRQGRPFL